jgi:hypothetical protein
LPAGVENADPPVRAQTVLGGDSLAVALEAVFIPPDLVPEARIAFEIDRPGRSGNADVAGRSALQGGACARRQGGASEQDEGKVCVSWPQNDVRKARFWRGGRDPVALTAAFAAAGRSQQIADRPAIEPAGGDDAIPDDDPTGPSADRHTVQPPSLDQLGQTRPVRAPRRTVKFRGVEIGQADLDPGRRVPRVSDTQTVAVADVAYDAEKGRAVAARQGALAGVGVGGARSEGGDDRPRQDRDDGKNPFWKARHPRRVKRPGDFAKTLRTAKAKGRAAAGAPTGSADPRTPP